MSALPTTSQLGIQPKYKTKPFMIGLHALGLFMSLVILSILLLAQSVMEVLMLMGYPSPGVFLIFNTITITFWIVWMSISLGAKKLFYEGNQWIRCSPLAVLAVFNMTGLLIERQWGTAIFALIFGLLIYVNHSMTDWWKPWKLSIPDVVYVMSPSPQPQFVMAASPAQPVYTAAASPVYPTVPGQH